MVNVHVIDFMDGSQVEHSTTTHQVFKRANGIEVIFRDEENLEYTVTLYPWHTVKEFHAFGILERGKR